jgi:hypothetical protein
MFEERREFLTRERILGAAAVMIGLIIIAASALFVEGGQAAEFFDDRLGTLFAPPSQSTPYILGRCVALSVAGSSTRAFTPSACCWALLLSWPWLRSSSALPAARG